MNGRTVTVPADELDKLYEDVARLTVRLGRLMSRAGIDLAPPPRPLPSGVVDLDAYRTARGGAA